jgi:hypothetical protein
MHTTHYTSLASSKRKLQDTDKHTGRSKSNSNIGNICSAAEQQFDADLQQEQHHQHVPLPKRRITGYLGTGFRFPSSSSVVSTSGQVMQGILGTSSKFQQQQQQQALPAASNTAADTCSAQDVPGIKGSDAGCLQDQLPGHDNNATVTAPHFQSLHNSNVTCRPRNSSAPLSDGSKRASSRKARFINQQQDPAAKQQQTATR